MIKKAQRKTNQYWYKVFVGKILNTLSLTPNHFLSRHGLFTETLAPLPLNVTKKLSTVLNFKFEFDDSFIGHYSCLHVYINLPECIHMQERVNNYYSRV